MRLYAAATATKTCREPKTKRSPALCLVCSALISFAAATLSMPCAGQGARLPTDAVDGFHAALKRKDTAGALSLLERGLVVFEFGAVDPTVEAYAQQHLPFDIDAAAATQWTVLTRRTGGDGNDRWVLTTYKVTGKDASGAAIDQTALETAILRRSGDGFRIVHLHWSTNDPGFQARVAGERGPQKNP